SFTGQSFHTTSWPDDFDPSGKRIAVIGTGCSAAQVVPEIAPRTTRLSLFQRTPAYVNPVPKVPYDQRRRRNYRWFPFLRARERRQVFRLMEDIFIQRYSEENRRAAE